MAASIFSLRREGHAPVEVDNQHFRRFVVEGCVLEHAQRVLALFDRLVKEAADDDGRERQADFHSWCFPARRIGV